MAKNYMLRFLPYIGYEEAVGYASKYQSGSLEELFSSESEALERLYYLRRAGVVEHAEVLEGVPGMGMCHRLLHEWCDNRTGEGEDN